MNLELLKRSEQSEDTLSSFNQLQIYHHEIIESTVKYTVLKLVFQYRQKLPYCVYPSNIKIQIFKVMMMSKDTDSTIVLGKFENDAAV